MNTKTMIKAATLLAAVGIWVGISPSALATLDLGTFVGSSGDRSASAHFVINNAGQLEVTLANTSTADVLEPVYILTALFFDIDPTTTTLAPVSASLNGSTVFYGPNGGGNVGGEYAYASGLNGAPGNTGLGISSAGFGLFGSGNFGGPNLQGPDSVDGLQYGLTSAGDNLTTGNAAVTGNFALIKNSVLFTLSINGALNAINNVSFQYGTALTDANVPVPEPSTYIAGGLLLIPLLVQLRRWKRSL